MRKIIKHGVARSKALEENQEVHGKRRLSRGSGRKGKQFGGGFNQPLGGVRAPVRPLGFKHGKSANKK